MSDDSKPTPSDNAVADAPLNPAPPERAAPQASPGQILSEARKARGMSVEELTGHTMLSRSTINALEADDYGRLSQPVFVRGYYRKCAKVLDIPEDRLMDAYAARTGVEGPKPASPRQVDVVPYDVTPGNRRTAGLVFLVVLGLAVLAFAWFLLPGLTRDTSGITSAVLGESANTETPANAPQAPLTAPAGEVASPAPDAAPEPSELASQQEPAPEPTPAENPDVSAGNEQSAAPAQAGLRMHFNQRSWVDVKNAAGERVLVGVVPADTDRTFPPQGSPYSVALGYAPGVEIYRNGQPVDLSGKTGSDNTARITVDLEQ